MGRPKKMTNEELTQWDKLYQYVKKEILQYDDTQKIPSNLILRLKGLATGKFIENKKIQDTAQYTYEIILFTFQANKQTILNCIKTKDFQNETAKFNYICKIIENNINDIYLRVANAKKTVEKTECVNTNIISHSGAEYIKQTKENKNTKLDELW